MKIRNLITKDVILCPAWLAAGILVALAAPVYFRYISGMNELFMAPVILLSAVFACNLTISRLCYIEDNFATKRLLCAMPVAKHEYVYCRYAEALTLTLGLLFLVILEATLIGVPMSFFWFAAFFLLGSLYEGAYLFVFYRWGSNMAQYTFVALFALLAAAYLSVAKLHLLQGDLSVTTGVGVILMIFGFAVYGCLMWASCKVCKLV